MEKIPRVLPNWEEWSPKMEIMGKEFHSGGATLSVGTLQPDRSWTQAEAHLGSRRPRARNSSRTSLPGKATTISSLCSLRQAALYL